MRSIKPASGTSRHDFKGLAGRSVRILSCLIRRIVKMLVEKGADVHAEKSGLTALSMAKASPFRWDKKRELIQILEKAGARQ